jgi:hypothetical protein
MKNLLFALFCLSAIPMSAQQPDVYQIESLTAPKTLLEESTPDQLYYRLEASVEKTSPMPKNLVIFNDHPFLTGILTAYREHRPFEISPDMMWLLISQGFARHITNNAEEFRNEIVGFQGKKTLIVVSRNIVPGNPGSNWEEVFPQFNKQISDYTGNDLTDALTANFSTTTPTIKIVSEITVMETVKAYFDYVVYATGCGLPSVTVTGTVADWEKVLAKTQYISKYDLKWWTNELEPILKQIIRTKKGKFDKKFWMNMVKFHSQNDYGSMEDIDGWIVKFFPYTKEGDKANLKRIADVGAVAPEIVKVPFILESGGQRYKMEFWAGFVGLGQDSATFKLTPEIGWAVVNVNEFGLNKSALFGQTDIENLSVNKIDTVPEDLFHAEKIENLHLTFLDQIVIPQEMEKISITNLELNGKITPEEQQRIRQMFRFTEITINGKKIPH